MSWAQRRKATYTITFLFILTIIAVVIVLVFFNKKPTCFDGVQNQGEQGVDCGGTCTILCRAQYSDPSIIWVRWSKVLNSGAYSVLAYGQNPNVAVGALSAPYTITIYDKNNVILQQKMGTTYIPPTSDFTVFVDNININDKVPARITFKFAGGFVWQKIINQETGIIPISKTIMNEDTAPKVFATLKNATLSPIQNIESIAILYDVDGNAIAFSRTKVDSIASDGTADIAFTWPERFDTKVYKIDILSKVLPK